MTPSSPAPAGDGHLSTLKLNTLALGQLPEGDRLVLDAHLAACERCRALRAELAADDEHFRREVYPRTLPRLTARRAPRFRLAFLLAPALALTLVLALRVLPAAPPRPDLGVKGGPTLQLFAKRGAQVFAVEPGTTLRPGDQVRFAVDPGDSDHVLIASRDGTGKFSIYYPFDAEESGAVTPDTRSELPGSLTLDDTLGDEQLWAVFSHRVLSARAVVEGLSSPDHGVAGADAVLPLAFRKAAP